MSYNPDVAISPGLKIQEVIDDLGVKQREFAERMGISEKSLSLLLNGKTSLSYEMSQKLSYVTGIDQSYWNRLEAAFQEDKLRLARANELEQTKNLVSLFSCYTELIKLGLIKKTRIALEKAEYLCQFLKISSLSVFESSNDDSSYMSEVLAFRKSNSSKLSKQNLVCWLMAGNILIENSDQEFVIEEFNRGKIKEIIPKLRDLTVDQNKLDLPSITSLLNLAGIYFIVLRNFAKVPVNGVSKIFKGHPCVQMSLRQGSLDSFWFTLFHELGHIHNGDLSQDKIILDMDSSILDEKETLADLFAQKFLIDQKKYGQLLEKKPISSKDVKELATDLGVGMNIIVGRLTHDLSSVQDNIYQIASEFRPTLKSDIKIVCPYNNLKENYL